MGKANQGTVLIVTIWILAILSILAIGIGFRTAIELRLLSYQIDSLKAYEIAKAGVMKARYEMEKDLNPDVDTIRDCGITLQDKETLEGKFAGNMGEGTYRVYYLNENQASFYGPQDLTRFININAAPREVLRRLHSKLTSETADNIRAWRGDKDIPSESASKNYFDKPYPCKNAAFDVASELLLVKDFPPEIFFGDSKELTEGGIDGLITVYPKSVKAEDFKVNINTASSRALQVVMAAAGFSGTITSTVPDNIVRDRAGKDGNIITWEDNIYCDRGDPQSIQNFIRTEAGPSWQGTAEESVALTALTNWIAVKSDLFLVKSKGQLRLKRSKIEKQITAVLKRSTDQGGAAKIEIVNWAEE